MRDYVHEVIKSLPVLNITYQARIANLWALCVYKYNFKFESHLHI
jgi:hypothetical protein